MSTLESKIRPLLGRVILRRADPEEFKEVTKADGTLVRIWYPDDSGQWAPAKKHPQVGYVLLHNQSDEFDEDLTDRVVVFTKWSDKEFMLQNTLFCVVDELDILAVFERGSFTYDRKPGS
jgi:co-chaperonin GroES (HSP10)